MTRISIEQIEATQKALNIFGKRFSTLYDRAEILECVQSFVWCTYRVNFPPIGLAHGPVSDSGWGCMHRVGQMVMAYVLRLLLLPPDWVWIASKITQNPIYWEIMDLILDKESSILSIHNISERSGKKVGAQLSPDLLSYSIENLWHSFDKRAHFGSLQIVSMNTPMFPVEDIRDFGLGYGQLYEKAFPNQPMRQDNKWQPVLVFLPALIMSGKNRILQILLANSQTVGFLGGYCGKAFWIVGMVEDDYFIGLDPHVTQEAVEPLNISLSWRPISVQADATYHTTSIAKIPLHQVEKSSGSLALLFRTEAELDSWSIYFHSCVLPTQHSLESHVLSLVPRLPSMDWICADNSILAFPSTVDEEESSRGGSGLSFVNRWFRRKSSQSEQPVGVDAQSVTNADEQNLNSRLLYFDWYGKLYRFTHGVKQLASNVYPN